MTRRRRSRRGLTGIDEAIETIASEIGKGFGMTCVECGKLPTHYGAYFCKECAADFYNEMENGEETE